MAHRTIQALGGTVKEKLAAAAITPGMLIERTSADKVQAHSTAGGAAQKLFAMESLEQGEEVTDAYALGEVVRFIAAAAGDEVVGLLANGEVVAVGTKVESNGDGYLRAVDTDSSAYTRIIGSIVGVALEALDMSDSSGADPASQLFRLEVW